MILKDRPTRNQKYLDWVETLPSVVSGRPADDAHHIKGHGYTGGVKPSDYMTFPLTRDEHTYFHDIGYNAWEEKYGSQLKFVIDTLMIAIQHGIFYVKL